MILGHRPLPSAARRGGSMAGPITRRRLLAAGVALPGCLGHRTDREIEHDLSKRVLACLNEDDADGLEALFCEASRARPELRAEMARGMGSFEGRVDLSAGWREGGWSTVSGGGLYAEGGRVLGRSVDPRVTGIVTDAGRRYKVVICYCDVSVDHPDWVGVSEIDIIATRPDGEEGEKRVMGKILR